MLKRIFGVCFISFMMVTSCNNLSNSLPIITSTPTPSLKITLMPVTSSAPKIAFTELPSAISSPSPISNFTQHCLSIPEKGMPLKSVATGVIAVGDLLTPPYLMDLVSQTNFDLPYQTKSGTVDRYSFGIMEAPNRNNLAYMEVFRDANGNPQYFKIRVVDSKAKILAERTIDKKDIRFWRWLNDETIQISMDSTIQEGKVILYSPFKQEWRELINNFPELYQDNSVRPSRYMIDYSPTLEWVIYLAFHDSGFGPIVFDLNSQKEIWKAIGIGAIDNRPLWSPVGDQIAVVAENRLYVISRNGHVSSPQGLAENDRLDDRKFAWSPNGQYIAFWLIRDAVGNLMLYDIKNDLTIDYCIKDIGLGNSIVWSPDSSNFITNVIKENPDVTRTEVSILIDVQNNVVYRLSTKKPIGWLK